LFDKNIDEKEKAENLGERKVLPVSDPARSTLFDKNIGEKEKAENLGERKVLPVLDPARSKLLVKIVNEFWEKFKNVPFTSVCEVLIDDKEAIVVSMDPGTSDYLPAKFKGFPVFICYETIELH
jgi:hypothetical protein